MTKLTKITTISLLAALTLTAAGTAQATSGRFSVDSAAAQQLRASMLRTGELADFATLDCPTSVTAADAWSSGDSSKAAALRAEGFEMGIREPLRSAGLGGLAFDSGARFATAQGARDALARVGADLASHAVASLRIAGVSNAVAHETSMGAAWEYSVVFVAGHVEHSIDVTLPKPASQSFVAQLAHAARAVSARS